MRPGGEDVYEGMAADYETSAADGIYNAHYDRPAVLGLAGDVHGRRVLDAGCGPGLYAEQLVDGGAEVVALDTSRAMVDLARRRLGDRATVVQGDLNRPLVFAGAEFDLVVCALVIHHVDDRTATLRELHRVLRPGGAVVLSTQHPTADWLRKGGSYFDVAREVDVWERYGRSYEVPFWREPLTSLCAAVADAGFLIERLVEPSPDESVRDRSPEDWDHLRTNPCFVVLRLVKPA